MIYQDFFENIPKLSFEPMSLTLVDKYAEQSSTNIQQLSNLLIEKHFPLVTSLSLKYIDEELTHVLAMKQKKLKKLKHRYGPNMKGVNISNLRVNDVEMGIEDNVQLMPNAFATLMKSSTEANMIGILLQNFYSLDPKIRNDKVYKLLKRACNYRFVNISFVDNISQYLDPISSQIVGQVWQIFQQYFQQFKYVKYLYNMDKIIDNANIEPIQSILNILLEISSNTCAETDADGNIYKFDCNTILVPEINNGVGGDAEAVAATTAPNYERDFIVPDYVTLEDDYEEDF